MSLKGLTSFEVEERIRQGKINKNIDETDRPVWEIVKRNTFTFFNLIFAVIAILISLVQAWNQLIFLPIIVINTIVGIYQEIKAKRYLDQMTLLHAPQSTVIRNGQQEKKLLQMIWLKKILLFLKQEIKLSLTLALSKEVFLSMNHF